MNRFSSKLLNAPTAFTFRDVIVLPGLAKVEPSDVSLKTRFSRSVMLNIPISSSPMDTVTEHAMAIELASLGGIGVIHRNMSIEEQVEEAIRVKRAEPRRYKGFEPAVDIEGRLLVGAAVSPRDHERAERLSKHVDVIVFDVAHFHNEALMSEAKRLVESVECDVVVGNIGTREAALDILSRIERVAGFRVGLSSGSSCITGSVTGVAAPTLYAVASVADACEELGVDATIIADGGIRGPGDILKAIAVGAHCTMLGYILAGTEEAPTPKIWIDGEPYKIYRGMGSYTARARRFSLDRYSQPSKNLIEGEEGKVKYRGPLKGVIEHLTSALRAGMGYAGASNIDELRTSSRIAVITPQGSLEIIHHALKG